MRAVSAKTQARIDLTGSSGKAFLLFCAQRMTAVCGGIASYAVREQTKQVALPYVGVASQLALLVITAWLAASFREGATAWHIRRANGKTPGFLPVYYWIRHARGLRAACLRCITAIYVLAQTALLLTPGLVLLSAAWYYRAMGSVTSMSFFAAAAGAAVSAAVGLVFAGVLSQRYGLSAYLLAKDPHRTLRGVIAESKARMAGRCLSMFCFKLSFLPWFLVSLTILPIVYTVPYYRQSVVCRMERICVDNGQ